MEESRPPERNDTIGGTPAELLDSLQRRANTLLTEFRSYQACLKSKGISKSIEVRIFRRGVESEHKNIGTLAERHNGPNRTADTLDQDQVETKDDASKRLQALRSSNLPFYEGVWDCAKRCRGMRALGKRLYWDPGTRSVDTSHVSPANDLSKQQRKQLKSVLIDIVADDGAEWIKVSIVSAKRLLFEMAKEGWEGYGDESEGDDSFDGEVGSISTALSGKLEIVRLAEDLRDASRATRVRYRHPQVMFVLPRINEGEEDSIDAVIADIRATGAIVSCGELSAFHCNHPDDHNLPSSPDFDRMLPSFGVPALTSTLNIDCTILLALISDISHVRRAELPPSPANQSGMYHSAILKQIEAEEEAPLLPAELYPFLAGKSLVCTSLAAQRMREIVQTMGTKSEIERAEILLGEGHYRNVSSGELKLAWQSLSYHELPSNVVYPIRVEDFTFSSVQDSPPSVASTTPQFPHAIAIRLAKGLRLSPINSSVFMYGWTQNTTTVTSNRVVATQIEKALNQILDEVERDSMTPPQTEDFMGPKVSVCETARSLVGKEKVNGLRP